MIGKRERTLVREIIKNFKRYNEKGGKSHWDVRGPYVPQKLIPMATRSQARKAERIMEGKEGPTLERIMRINPRRAISGQSSLRFASLLWNLKHWDRMQRYRSKKHGTVTKRGENLPCVVFVDGKPYIWNGNHRTTVGLLLDRYVLVRATKARYSPAKRPKRKG